MSVEAHELMGDDWTRWQGHLVNGVYPLGRFLGCSDHSGVFLTRSAASPSRDVAIKLVPATRTAEELQLPRWTLAAGLTHPHLLPLLESGACQLDGLPYHYAIMEYADQTLAQVLRQRALTADEAREMLQPILDALVFLHRQGWVQGQLKPSNVLVVGDQLKLASDTIRRAGEDPVGAASVYDPPKGPEGIGSTADDIWALGISLYEALTRRSPPSAIGPRGSLALPSDFAAALREVVTRCLSPRAQDRPTATDLQTWAGGGSLPAPPAPAEIRLPAAPRAPEPNARQPAPPPPVPAQPEAAAAPRVPPVPQSKTPAVVASLVVAAVVLALGWRVIPAFRGHVPDPVPASAGDATTPQAPSTALPATQPGADTHAPASASPAKGDATQSAGIHQVIPSVSKSAARSIRGHLEVSVQATVRPDGSVSTVTVDRSARSKYFQRVAVDAARKWTFPAIHGAPARVFQVTFEFSRDGTVAHAAPLP